MQADQFLTGGTLLIIALGLFAFVFDTVGGVLFAKFINLFVKRNQPHDWCLRHLGVPHVQPRHP